MEFDEAPSEHPAVGAVREAMLEMIADRLRLDGASRDLVEFEMARRAKNSEYDLGTELRQMMRRAQIVIPAGTTGRPCRSCDATIYWLPFKDTVRKHAISIAGPGCCAPTKDWHGLGFAHLADCPASGLRLKEYGTLGIESRPSPIATDLSGSLPALRSA